jgi:hypothetical protein
MPRLDANRFVCAKRVAGCAFSMRYDASFNGRFRRFLEQPLQGRDRILA